MATSKQEKLYNEMVEYYHYSEKLLSVIESFPEPTEEQFKVIESIIENIESYADRLTTRYIEYVKDSSSEGATEEIKKVFNDILSKTEDCRNKIYMLYRE